MDSAITDEILDEVSSVLQRVEAQSTAILELIKEKGIASEDELTPYLQRANEASSVRWRATRVRLEHLLSGLEKRDQQSKPERKEKEGAKEEKEEHRDETTQSAGAKTIQHANSASQEKPGGSAQKPKAPEEKSQTAQTVESSSTDHEPKPGPQAQQQTTTATSKAPEPPPDKADPRKVA